MWVILRFCYFFLEPLLFDDADVSGFSADPSLQHFRVDISATCSGFSVDFGQCGQSAHKFHSLDNIFVFTHSSKCSVDCMKEVYIT